MSSAVKEPAIEIKNITKSFHIPLEGSSSLKQKIINGIKRKKGYRIFTPLNNISLTIEKGDFFGIVGKNGSGKSTLLKTIAGIYHQDAGELVVNGSLVPFIELGVGFNPELTGRENIYLNGALLGFSRKEIEEKYEEIVKFSELKDFIDEKLKNYSSGMQVRLAFSIAIQSKSDILLLDEVLAVGDSAFQQKCFDYFNELKRQKQTVVFISHDMEAVKKFCNKAVLIESGRIKAAGTPQEIADDYLIDNFQSSAESVADEDKHSHALTESDKIGNLRAKINPKGLVKSDTKIILTLYYEIFKTTNVELRLALMKEGISFAHINTRGTELPTAAGAYSVDIEVSAKHLLEGTHEVYFGVYDAEDEKQLAFKNKAAVFYVKRSEPTKYGLMYLDATWHGVQVNSKKGR